MKFHSHKIFSLSWIYLNSSVILFIYKFFSYLASLKIHLFKAWVKQQCNITDRFLFVFESVVTLEPLDTHFSWLLVSQLHIPIIDYNLTNLLVSGRVFWQSSLVGRAVDWLQIVNKNLTSNNNPTKNAIVIVLILLS